VGFNRKINQTFIANAVTVFRSAQ